jgi:hypothetical protein
MTCPVIAIYPHNAIRGEVSTSLSRLAHALASSFNFQGRVKKTFYVLTDNKVGAGPRLRPNSLAKEPSKDSEPAMEVDATDATDATASQPPDNPTAPVGMTLSTKLAAKRKHSDAVSDSPSKARR